MVVKTGDLVQQVGIYSKPGVVIERQKDGMVKIDTEPMSIHRYHGYTNTTGLELEEKKQFNAILDRIYKFDKDVDKINEIQHEIDKLRLDSDNKNIIQYLRNQQSQLIRKAHELPRYYKIDETKI